MTIVIESDVLDKVDDTTRFTGAQSMNSDHYPKRNRCLKEFTSIFGIIDGDGLINLITDTEKLIAVNSVTYCDRSSSETRGQKSKSRITQNKTLK